MPDQDRLLAKALPSGFAYVTSRGTWRTAPHLDLATEKLVDLSERRIRRLLFEIPPRHGKSELGSKYFPAHYLGSNPDHRIGISSYESGFAESWSEKARDLLIEHGPELFHVAVHPKRNAAADWRLYKRMGQVRASGVQGSMTGRGFNLLVIDDPIKDAKEAMSATIRQNIWDWYTSTAYTRLEPDAIIVLIMTRWHEDDLAGRLLKQMKEGGEHWTRVRLPALAEDDDPLGRPEGAPLWPWRYDLAALQQIQRTIGTYWWSALYQQRPQPLGGGIFKRKWFRYFVEEHNYYTLKTPERDKRVPKDLVWRFMTVDPAASEDAEADWFCVGHFGVTPDGDLLRLHVVREQIQGPEQITLVRNLYDNWLPGFIGVETAAYQLTLFQHLLKKGLPVRKIQADRDKISKALVLAAKMENGQYYERGSADWLDICESEMLLFPKAEHDDTVDIASFAAIEADGMTLSEPRVRST